MRWRSSSVGATTAGWRRGGGDPNLDRAEQDGEAGAGRDQRETPADERAGESESGDGAGGEGREDGQAGTGLEGTGQSQVRSW